MSLTHLQAAAERLLNGKPEDLGFNLSYLRAALDQSLSNTFKSEIREGIEQTWLTRAKTQQLGKPSSQKYRTRELEFFVGAMAALQALMPDKGDDALSSFVPPAWVVLPMSGGNIVQP